MGNHHRDNRQSFALLFPMALRIGLLHLLHLSQLVLHLVEWFDYSVCRSQVYTWRLEHTYGTCTSVSLSVPSQTCSATLYLFQLHLLVSHWRTLYQRYFFSQKSIMASHVRIWSWYGRCRLAFETRRLTVPPMPSQALLPCEVAKKFHSASSPKSSLWQHKLMKLFLFLYWPAHPSLK